MFIFHLPHLFRNQIGRCLLLLRGCHITNRRSVTLAGCRNPKKCKKCIFALHGACRWISLLRRILLKPGVGGVRWQWLGLSCSIFNPYLFNIVRLNKLKTDSLQRNNPQWRKLRTKMALQELAQDHRAKFGRRPHYLKLDLHHSK